MKLTVRLLTDDLSLIEQEINTPFPDSVSTERVEESSIECFGAFHNTDIQDTPLGKIATIRANDSTGGAIKALVEASQTFSTFEVLLIDGMQFNGEEWEPHTITWQEAVEIDGQAVTSAVYDENGNETGREPCYRAVTLRRLA